MDVLRRAHLRHLCLLPASRPRSVTWRGLFGGRAAPRPTAGTPTGGPRRTRANLVSKLRGECACGGRCSRPQVCAALAHLWQPLFQGGQDYQGVAGKRDLVKDTPPYSLTPATPYPGRLPPGPRPAPPCPGPPTPFPTHAPCLPASALSLAPL